MHEGGLAHIQISKVIHAQRWRVVRLITKVSEFPEYVPCVKEASVIHKARNHMKTRWRIEVDKIPVTWIEEDTLSLKEETIRFNATEGDLEEFKGEWRFQDDPSGTKVTVDVYIKAGIPAIKEFADTYIKGLIRKTFEAIITAVERRIISTKYAADKNEDFPKTAGFGIVGHLYNYQHLVEALKSRDPAFKLPSREFLGQLFSITPSFKVSDIHAFTSKTGETTSGCFIMATFIPEMLDEDRWGVFSKVVKSCRIAEKHGVGVVSLAGFASIAEERIGHSVAAEVEVPVTTGNTFTAGVVLDGVFEAARLLNLDISSAAVAIIGGSGDVGTACARVLADKARRLILTGRNRNNLRRIQRELAKRKKADIHTTIDNKAAVQEADIVITAASALTSIVESSWCKPGAIVCDVGYPRNVAHSPSCRDDIFVFSGGLVKSPAPISFPLDIGLPADDVIYASFAEAIILALEKRYENFSSGRGNITPDKIEEIRSLGKKHGFELSDFYWGSIPTDTISVKDTGGKSSDNTACCPREETAS